MNAEKYMYRPTDAGKEITSSRGNVVTIRKYHMTPEEMVSQRKEWEETIKDVPEAVKNLAHPQFFNPYRRGVYFGQVQAMYLLGANQWHELSVIIEKTREILQKIPVYHKNKITGESHISNVWDRFASKTPKEGTQRNRDIIGRMQENMIFCQRLTCLHPSGYKLKQVCAAVDVKKVRKEGIPNGVYLYRLSTYDSEEKALPIRDFGDFIEEEKSPCLVGSISCEAREESECSTVPSV